MQPTNIVILGAGITGLTTAWYLERLLGGKAKITLVEKAPRVGGWIQTLEHKGFMFEKGPRSLRGNAHDGIALELIDLLGLQKEVILPSPSAKDRYVWHEGKLEKAPSGLWQTVSSPLTKDLLGTFLKEWTRPKKENAAESIYAFIARRYSTEVAERLIDPLTACIYGGDIKELSVKACFPFLSEWENLYGSVLSGALRSAFKKGPSSPALITFRDGMETLPKKLASLIKGNILLNSEVSRLQSKSITLSNGKSIPYDIAISTLPAHVLGRITSIPEIFTPAGSLAVVNLGWNSKVTDYEGFGCVYPSKAELPLLGIVWDSSAFPSQNKHPDQTRITLMLGGSHSPVFPSLDDETIQRTALDLVNTQLKISLFPEAIHIGRSFNAIPHYQVDHKKNSQDWKKILKDFFPNLWVAGTTYDGVAVTACLSSARNIAFDVSEFAKKPTAI